MPETPPKHDPDDRISLAGRDPEEVLKALLKVDPDAPPAKRNKEEPVEEAEPLKDQGDPLTGS
jgi:hypothetical protein